MGAITIQRHPKRHLSRLKSLSRIGACTCLLGGDVTWATWALVGIGFVGTLVSSIAYNFRIRSTNNGGTPAWITEKRARMVVVEVLPATPNWDDPGFIDPELEPLAVGGKTETKNVELSCSGREDGKMVVVYGIVKYRDVLRPERTDDVRLSGSAWTACSRA